MKKVFALILAVAMVLSLSAVAFAAPTNTDLINEDESVPGYLDVAEDSASTWDSDEKTMTPVAVSLAYGKTVYYAVMVAEEEEGEATNPATDSKQVSGLRITPKWTDGADYVKSVEFAKKGGAYYVAVVTTGSKLTDSDLSGKIYIKGTSGTGDDKYKVDGYFNVDLNLDYKRVTKDDELVKKDTKKIFATTTKTIFEMDNIDRDDVTVYFVPKADAAEGITKNAAATAVIDATNEEDVLLAYSVDEVDEVVDAYPKANLDFLALTGSFKKTAEVTIYADEGSFLYKVVDGKAVKVDAEYDEWEEGFVFNTKTLGAFVISDIELAAAAAVTETPEAGSSNPTTGAAA